jgi:phosphate uptake regulator
MFKNLLRFWKGKDFLSSVLEEFKQMLNDAQDMFNSVCKKLIYNEEIEGLEDKIFNMDKKINDLEKNIRTKIIEHLSLQPSVDVPACLVLMSVVKDVERLGDYCKNLFEITQLLDKPIDKDRYQGLFNEMDKEISELFTQTKEAFIESDETKASSSWDYERKIVKKCDKIIEQLAKGNFSVNESVCLTLIARYFKRLTAHLTNIATSVILPLSELDYFDERRRRQEDNKKT